MKILPLLTLAFVAFAPALPASPKAGASSLEVGVYYYSGWHSIPKELGAKRPPWEPIRAYPDRKPLRGWYQGDDVGVVDEQMRWMREYGIKYAAFDWYYEKGTVHLDEPLNTYLKLGLRGPEFSLLWANHGEHTTRAAWDDIINIWNVRYFSRRSYYKIDGRSVVFVYSAQRLARDAEASGQDLGVWVDAAQRAMRRAKLPPIYFVGGVFSADEPIIPKLKGYGFSAVSAYNFNGGPGDKQASHGYAERDDAYRRQWQSAISRTNGLPLVVPMSSGWDRRPWGGSPDPLRDNSISSPEQFLGHLIAAKQFMRRNNLHQGIICCWNEYGEGSFIEPTQSGGFDHLATVRRAFP